MRLVAEVLLRLVFDTAALRRNLDERE